MRGLKKERIGESVALELVRAFLAAKYTGEDRHQRRLGKLMAIEGRYATMDGGCRHKL